MNNIFQKIESNSQRIFLFFGRFLIFFLLSYQAAYSATVNSATNTVALNFGIIDPDMNGTGGAGGTMKSSCATTGTVRSLNSGCLNASFTVRATRNSGTGTGKLQFKVVIKNASTGLYKATDSTPIAFSLDSAASTVSKTFSVANVAGAQNVVVPLYSTLTLIGAQVPGVYNKTSGGSTALYSFVACTCPNTGCPADASCL